jgi:hypothetical protein
MRQQTNKLFTASFPFLIFPFQFFSLSIAVITDFRPFYSYLSLIDALTLPGIKPGTTAWQSSAVPARHFNNIYCSSVLMQ